MHVEYLNDVDSTFTSIPTGLSELNSSVIKGYMTGTLSGDASRMEMRIANKANPGLEIGVEVITTGNGDVYLKGPATGQQWWKFTESEFDELDEENDLDASLFGFELLTSVFDESNALFNGINRNSTVYVGEDEVEGRTYELYEVEVAIPDYLDAVKNREDISEKEVDQYGEIVRDAIISGSFWVDPKMQRIAYMDLEARNIKQLKTEASEYLGLTTKHDTKVWAEFSRYDIPLDIVLPEEDEIVEAPMNSDPEVLGISTDQLQ